MGRIGNLAAVLIAPAGMLLGGLAGPTTGPAAQSLAPVITHSVRLDAVGGGHETGAGTSATWESSNWSGYAETGTFTAVSDSWTVPTVTAGASSANGGGRFGRSSATSAWYSATWVGIDGFDNSDLIQTGTEQDYYDGAAHYSAWWEILPAAETTITTGTSYPVSPGDVMDASIVETPTQVSTGGRGIGRGHSSTEYEWTINIKDASKGWTFTTTQSYGGPGTSAEWVVEAPEVGDQIAPLANYSFPTTSATIGDFNNAEVATTIGGTLSGRGLNYANDAGVMIQNNAQVSTPGQPGPVAKESFNALYGASVPSTPTN